MSAKIASDIVIGATKTFEERGVFPNRCLVHPEDLERLWSWCEAQGRAQHGEGAKIIVLHGPDDKRIRVTANPDVQVSRAHLFYEYEN